jgi:hypothetical protein
MRDRVTYARQCLAALAAAGLEVHVADHASTWPAALAWLAGLEESGEAVVHRRGENAYPWALWQWGPFRDVMSGDDQPYVVTDPDVIPSGDCPADWPQRLAGLLAASQARPGPRGPCVKAGLGLRLDRLPAARREEVTSWERVFWADEQEPGVYRANVDTTLALCRPYTEYPLFSLGPALRTGFPYVADHLAWYEDPGSLSPELRHYRSRADAGHEVARSLKD